MTVPLLQEGKRGLWDALVAEASAEVGRLAAEAARSLGCDGGLEAAEAVIRAGMLELGTGVLGKLLAADPGYRGPRVDCGAGHQAEFVSYRDKVIDTVLGPVTLTRAWYRCAACEHGLAASRRFLVRTVLPRWCSRWSRKLVISGALMSAKSSPEGALLVWAAANSSRSRQVAR